MTLRIDLWSDIACPWCYVGKRRLEGALSRFPQRASVSLTWRSFELDPDAPRTVDPEVSYAERLARKYATSLAQAEEMIRTMTRTAAEEGLDFHFEKIRPGNTFDAHRLLHFAEQHGKADAMKERLLRAYLTEGEPIGDRDVLARLAGEAQLEIGDVRGMLASTTYEEEVRADEEEARVRGISGVPFFLIDGRYGISGAQSAEGLLTVLNRAWEERALQPAAEDPSPGGSCGPEGCG